MTVLTLRRIRQDRFEVTGPDIEPVTFKTRGRRGTGALSITGVADPGGWQERRRG